MEDDKILFYLFSLWVIAVSTLVFYRYNTAKNYPGFCSKPFLVFGIFEFLFGVVCIVITSMGCDSKVFIGVVIFNAMISMLVFMVFTFSIDTCVRTEDEKVGWWIGAGETRYHRGPISARVNALYSPVLWFSGEASNRSVCRYKSLGNDHFLYYTVVVKAKKHHNPHEFRRMAQQIFDRFDQLTARMASEGNIKSSIIWSVLIQIRQEYDFEIRITGAQVTTIENLVTEW